MTIRSVLLCCVAFFHVAPVNGQVATPGVELLKEAKRTAPANSQDPDAAAEQGTDELTEPAEAPHTAELDPVFTSPKKESKLPSPFRQVADNSVEEPLDDVPPAKSEPKPEELSPEMRRLRSKVLAALSLQMNKPRQTTRHSPWGIMHAMHAFGVETTIRNERNQLVNAAGWLCWNRSCRGRTMMYTNSDGELRLRLGPGYQGHEGQFLALLAQARVKRDFELRVSGRRFTVGDLVEYEKETCKPGTELTFKLIGLAHYEGPDAQWENRYGAWTIPRLIDEELRQPVVGAACGGTHRLFGHSYALNRARKTGVEIDGAWKRAQDYVLSYQRRAVMLQNRDGSFSTEWFERRGMSSDPERRLQTTGHILEWMVFSLPEVDLKDRRITRSVNYLASLMLSQRRRDWEIGPRGHAIRALALYDQRVFGGSPGKLDRRLSQLVPNHSIVR